MIAVLSRMVRVGSSEKVKQSSKLEGGKGTSHRSIWKRSIHTEEAANLKALKQKCMTGVFKKS